MRLAVRVAGVVATAMMAGSLVSCGSSGAPQQDAVAVRQDREPIQKRVTNIGEAYRVKWLGDVSGPTTSRSTGSGWIDANIVLRDDEVAARLRDAAGEPVTHEVPDVPAEINRSGDPGITSAGLDSYVAVEPGTVRAYLYPERGVLVIKYRGGN
ncbi:Lipoprotein OS=Tsukamurella paurometabola (strain ATCC 8368 / DSM / CCUG 35730 / CIP 100753/ JCM 10117 / KCTC 9821 / NBRC 16120 / NCIMB 702349 / NCTC 13040)OX=521096 GN=Tpau_4015 PE=4 SV=1 [Tsukamurella paurometabola]|uniref:Lipoprotein n=1 Tax=Tsukamurella paurometabola (strain ATCC 8368 / DSM 20162 / CCUG 35730 / CIP 100753 / JCM 10117 / KCTC 9821 / NBRC 16120 / NCIMB 702349 / NCTC 13040) TaxID=521096 RepID=D5UN91_TSUPD|nr:hypothetical protein [Tsukamurella paurometabola]ADG80586.1 conserved hypothetical protein [Tsukamurella paurometabola DSM 20162]SUP40188.1 Uncharacterised protein [Tsukamurella paurometabola]